MKNLFIILMTLIAMNSFANEKIGLLIIAHGSPAKQWNQPVFALEAQVKTLLKQKQIGGFEEVRVALMEFAEPSIASVVKDMENKGVTKIFALPLFIAPSSHSLIDLPTILGLHYCEKNVQELKEEGIELVKSSIQITLGPSLDYGTVIRDILLGQLRLLSENPEDEALVILSHGDDHFMPFWEELSTKTGNYILGKTGIEYFDKAFVGIGQSFGIKGVDVILKASEHKKRVIVLGMYLSMSVERMAENSSITMMGRTVNCMELFERKDVVFSKSGLLSSSKISEWIVERAINWLNK